MSFIMVLLSIYVIGFILLSRNYEISMQEQIDKSISQINTVYHSFMLYENKKGIETIANQYKQDKIYIEVEVDQNLIYSTITNNVSNIKEKIKSSMNNTTNTYTYLENTTLYTFLERGGVDILMSTDITKLKENRSDQIRFFIQLTIFFSILVALILSLLVKLLTNKIKKLNQIATEIEKGNYDITIPPLGKDEVGSLGKTFHTMTTSIRKNINELNRTAEIRQEFIHDLTHEIRTPLTSIIGYSSLMKNKKVTQAEKVTEYAQKIYQEGMYLKELTDKLIDMILLEEQTPSFQEIDLSEALKKIAKEIAQKYPFIFLETNITSSIFRKVDRILLQILVENLVKNAMNAYEHQDGKVIVTLTPTTLTVKDFGKGIPPDETEKIVQPFYTEKKDRNREFSGMGLGLPLCMRIIAVFGWKLTIKSEVKKGTEMIIGIGENNEES